MALKTDKHHLDRFAFSQRSQVLKAQAHQPAGDFLDEREVALHLTVVSPPTPALPPFPGGDREAHP